MGIETNGIANTTGHLFAASPQALISSHPSITYSVGMCASLLHLYTEVLNTMGRHFVQQTILLICLLYAS